MTNKKRKTKYAPEVKESIIKLYQTGRSDRACQRISNLYLNRMQMGSTSK